jgi:hypothetical protein
MPTLEKYLGVVYLWKYIPNLPAAITFAILFLLVSMVHGWIIARTKLWLCLPFFIGGSCKIPLRHKYPVTPTLIRVQLK